MKKGVISAFLLFTLFSIGFSQTPTNCFEIESIMADACGGNEPENEMFLFHVGPYSLNVSGINIDFPNNSFRGICQNANTAQRVNAINRQIAGCGWFLEPVGGILPAASKVLVITSENLDTLAHDFSATNDTFYIIFQCNGNIAAHFLNASATSAPRTLSMTINPPLGCGDTVTYNAMYLVDTAGIPGPGPSIGARNGSSAAFTWSGTPSYFNYGCRPPFIPLQPDAGIPVNLCEGDTVPLSGSSPGGNYFFQWSGGQGIFNSHTSLNPIYYPATGETGSFYLYLTEYSSCDSVKDSVLITLSPPPNLNLGPDTVLCGSASYIIDAGPGANTYLWSTGANSQTININISGWYSVVISDGLCSNSDSILVSLGTPLIVNAGPDITLCQGSSVMLDAGQGPANFLWSTSETTQTISVNSPGIYTVVGSNPCTADSDTVQVFLYPLAIVNAGTNASLCQGDTLQIQNASASSGTLIWRSTGNGIFTNSSSLITSYLTVNDTGDIFLILSLTDSCGIVSDTLILSVNPLPMGNLSATDTICFGDSVWVNYQGAATSIFWYGGSGIFSDPIAMSTFYYPTSGETGIVTFYATTGNSCGTVTDSISVLFSDSLTAEFNWTPTLIYPGTYIHFNNQSSTTGNTLIWDFGDSKHSVIQSPDYFYFKPGTYLVHLEVEDNFGCINEISRPLIVISPDTIVPDIFSPNGDGMNDFLMFKLQPLLAFDLQILDRWGNLVFQSKDINQSWDGKSNGKECQEGVYYYVVRATLVVGEFINKTGNVTLVR